MANQYFQHDFNARNSLQIQALIREFGAEGYGVFWAIVEMLHEKKNRLPLKEYVYSGISAQIRSEIKKVEEIIRFCIKTELFREKKSVFSSTRVKRNIIKRLGISKTKAEAGRRGAEARQNQANINRKVNVKSIGIYPAREYEINLSETEASKAVEYLQNIKGVKATPEMINSLWATFKIKNFTGENFYHSDQKIIKHFFETLKFENIPNGTHKQHNTGSTKTKLGTSAAINKADRDY